MAIILNILYWMALFGFMRLKEMRWFAIFVAIFTVVYMIYLFTTTEYGTGWETPHQIHYMH